MPPPKAAPPSDWIATDWPRMLDASSPPTSPESATVRSPPEASEIASLARIFAEARWVSASEEPDGRTPSIVRSPPASIVTEPVLPSESTMALILAFPAARIVTALPARIELPENSLVETAVPSRNSRVVVWTSSVLVS